MTKRKNVAIIGVGVVGIPVLTEILKSLSSQFNITVYSFIPVEGGVLTSHLRIRCMPRFPIHLRLKYVLLGLWFIADHIRSPYKIIHAQSAFPGGVLARFLSNIFNLPWIVTLIGGEVEAIPHIPFGDLLNARLKKITYKVCDEADCLIVLSQFHEASVRKNLNLQRDIKLLSYAPIVGSLVDKEITLPVRLIHVAYNHPVKNHDMLLAAVARLVDKIPFQLTIIGANYDEEFQQKLQELNLDSYIKIAGPKSYNEIEKFYKEAHIMIHTSWYESLAVVALEAMAHGVVVCSTHVGIMSDLARTCCLTVETGQDQRMAEVVLDLIADPDRYEQLRIAAYTWAKAHDSNYYVTQIASLYNQLSK